ncbi:HpcH/HpaI aldolase family protein [Microbacterium sp. JZ101]
MSAQDLASRVRSGEPVVGYWIVTDNPFGTERIARAGYDYVAFDLQHGLLDHAGLLRGVLATDAVGSAGAVRVGANTPADIGRALDAGAVAVIVPLVNTAEEAAAAVAAAHYPPRGVRSYGPMRSGLRVGPVPAEADRSVLVFAMIETPEALENLDAIAATPGLDGLYIGPSDLTIALGGKTSTDSAVEREFDAAIERIRLAAEANGIVPGIHSPSGAVARLRLAQGFRFVSVASDLTHLEAAAASHLSDARADR